MSRSCTVQTGLVSHAKDETILKKDTFTRTLRLFEEKRKPLRASSGSYGLANASLRFTYNRQQIRNQQPTDLLLIIAAAIQTT